MTVVYKNKFVVAVKVGGKVLRETNESVILPFGSEYSLLLKNLNSVRTMAQVSIDGTDAVGWVIIEPNSSVELERFIRDGNLDRGNKFKFIERTQAVENHRGVKADDGLIRIEYKTEKVERVEHVPVKRYYYDDWYTSYPWTQPCSPWPKPCSPPWCLPVIYGNATMASDYIKSSAGFSGNTQRQSQNVNCQYQRCSVNVNDAGITVLGSESSQRFVAHSGFETFNHSDVVVIHLRGMAAGKLVDNPVLVMPATCSTCGKRNKGNPKFCGQCGTSLVII
jgi:hypothetical protein